MVTTKELLERASWFPQDEFCYSLKGNVKVIKSILNKISLNWFVGWSVEMGYTATITLHNTEQYTCYGTSEESALFDLYKQLERNNLIDWKGRIYE